jgi:hypothetical protein
MGKSQAPQFEAVRWKDVHEEVWRGDLIDLLDRVDEVRVNESAADVGDDE